MSRLQTDRALGIKGESLPAPGVANPVVQGLLGGLQMHVHPKRAIVVNSAGVVFASMYSPRNEDVELAIMAVGLADGVGMLVRRFDARGKEIK